MWSTRRPFPRIHPPNPTTSSPRPSLRPRSILSGGTGPRMKPGLPLNARWQVVSMWWSGPRRQMSLNGLMTQRHRRQRTPIEFARSMARVIPRTATLLRPKPPHSRPVRLRHLQIWSRLHCQNLRSDSRGPTTPTMSLDLLSSGRPDREVARIMTSSTRWGPTSPRGPTVALPQRRHIHIVSPPLMTWVLRATPTRPAPRRPLRRSRFLWLQDPWPPKSFRRRA